jgi:hypothetical protein
VTNLAFLPFTARSILLSTFTLCNTSSHLTRSVQLISTVLQHHTTKLSKHFCSVFRSVQTSATYKSVLEMQHFIWQWRVREVGNNPGSTTSGGISWLDEKLVDSHEGLYFTELADPFVVHYFHFSAMLSESACFSLTLYLLTWRIWRAPNNASKGQMGFNSAFKGLNI